MTRRTITRDMMEACLAKRWNAGQAAKHFGFHRKSIESACERFGIVLPLMTFGKPLTAPQLRFLSGGKGGGRGQRGHHRQGQTGPPDLRSAT